MGLAQDFKAFVLRGNVVDLAVGVIIGASFGKIVSSLVADVVMPPIGLLVGGVNFTELKVELAAAVADAAGKVTTPAVTLNYGNFLQTVFDFLIIAAAVFAMITALQRLQKKQAEAPAAPSPPPPSEVLLAEIRDLLKKK